MPHSTKVGDTKTLRWSLGRDLTTVTDARVVIALKAGDTPAVDRNGVIEDPATDGVVSLALEAGDYAAGKLEPGVYRVEIEIEPGPLTHPDDGYETLTVVADLEELV
jgi:hypothetical protein